MRSSTRAETDGRQLLDRMGRQTAPPSLPGFRLVRDSFVRPWTNVRSYVGIHRLASLTPDTRVFIQYGAVLSELVPFKLTIVDGNGSGLHHRKVQRISQAFVSYRLFPIEVAFEFQPRDLQFAKRDALRQEPSDRLPPLRHRGILWT